jgi:hypothetical protein
MSKLLSFGQFASLLYKIYIFYIKAYKDLIPSMMDALFKGIRDFNGKELLIGSHFIDHFRSQIGDQIHPSFKGPFAGG